MTKKIFFLTKKILLKYGWNDKKTTVNHINLWCNHTSTSVCSERRWITFCGLIFVRLWSHFDNLIPLYVSKSKYECISVCVSIIYQKKSYIFKKINDLPWPLSTMSVLVQRYHHSHSVSSFIQMTRRGMKKYRMRTL